LKHPFPPRFETELCGGQIEVAAACQQLSYLLLELCMPRGLTNGDLREAAAACQQNEDSQSALSYPSPQKTRYSCTKWE